MKPYLSRNNKKHIISKQAFAFNVWDIVTSKAIIDAAVIKQVPLFIQISSKIYEGLDKEEFIYSVKRYIKKNNAEIIIHLDHCRSIEQIKEAISYGWDSVMYDGSHLDLNENIKMSQEIVRLCKPHEILVEAEIGQIKGVEDNISTIDVSAVKTEDVIRFINNVDVDMLAINIGTCHGQYNHAMPCINYSIIEDVGKLTELPIVIHGGSELTSSILSTLLSFKNVKKINISTDVKQTYRKALINSFEMGLLSEKGFDATKLNNAIYTSIISLVLEKLKMLGSSME